MVYEIVWSDNAKEDLRGILLFLYEEWSQTAVDNFFEKLDKTISIIELMPNSGKKYSENNETRCLGVSNLISVYYDIFENTITILNLFDNRQSPNKKP